MAFRKLARADEIPPGHTRFFRIRGKPVILANWAGKIHALGGICPHQGYPLEGATVWDHLLDCPWHHFQYDVRTGKNRYPRNVYPDDLPGLRRQVGGLKKYALEVRDGEVWVDLK